MMEKPVPFGEARPVLISKVDPKYTDEARERRIQGLVLVRVYVDETGAGSEAEILQPLGYGLDLAALEALALWRFRPATRREFGEIRPAGIWMNVGLEFRLL